MVGGVGGFEGMKGAMALQPVVMIARYNVADVTWSAVVIHCGETRPAMRLPNGLMK